MEQTAAHTDYFRGGVGWCHIHAQTHGIQHSEHPARHHADRREHILLVFQQAHKDKAHQAAAGHGRRTERTYGRILRHAGTAGGAVFREFRTRQGPLSRPDTGLLLHRQSDDDHGEGIQRILHHIRGNGICLRYRGRGDWQHDGGMGVQTHHGLAAQIHHLCLYRHKRTDFPAGGIAAIHYGRTTIPSIYMHLTQKNCY